MGARLRQRDSRHRQRGNREKTDPTLTGQGDHLPDSRSPIRRRATRDFVTLGFLRRLRQQGAGYSLDVGNFLSGSGAHIVAHQLLATFADLIVSRRVLTPDGEQFFEPVFAVAGVHGFVRPVEVHVVLAHGIAVGVEELGPGRLVFDVFGFKKVEHAQKVDQIFTRGALVDVRSQRNLCRVEAPGYQALVAHAAVARFVVGPARRIVNPLPGQDVGKGAQNYAAGFNRPHFVQVTDGRAQLQSDPFAVGICRINYVRPVEAARPKAWVSRGPGGNGVRVCSRKRPGGASRWRRPNPYSAYLRKPICNRLGPGEGGFA